MPRVTLGDRRVLVPEAILPEQFGEIWRRRITTPEVALMLAMLTQAIGDLRPSRVVRSYRYTRRLYREAYVWVDSLDRSHPFSFTNVCEAVGLSAEALRERLLGNSSAGDKQATPVVPVEAGQCPLVAGSAVARRGFTAGELAAQESTA